MAVWGNATKKVEESVHCYAEGIFRELEGIAVGIKDEHYENGWVVTQESLIHQNDPPKDHADPIVSKLKAAVTIAILQTTDPDLYLDLSLPLASEG